MRLDKAFLLVVLSIPALAVLPAIAASDIAVSRGGDSNVYGNCVPSLVVENRSGETIDYLQVDVVLALRDGRQRTVELKSAYREGAPFPIVPGASATLRQHIDTSRALGVSSPVRYATLPDTPTVAEALNAPGFEVDLWYGLFVPSQSPREAVQVLNREMREILVLDEVKAGLAAQGMVGALPIGDEVSKCIRQPQVRRQLSAIVRTAQHPDVGRGLRLRVGVDVVPRVA